MKAEPECTKAQAAANETSLVIRVTWGSDTCNTTLDCGGSCILAANHSGPCECAGDQPGEPGTCPA